jgi:predicted RecA/RadA family phage recombinase
MAQTFQARRLGTGEYIDYTPSSAVSAGDVVVDNGLLLIAEQAVASGVEGSFAVRGEFDLVKVNGSMSVGAVVYWDDDGNPQGGTAGTGAVTTTSTSNTPVGRVIAAAGATDEKVAVKLFDAPSVTNTTTSVGPDVAEITDPGDAGAVPVTTSGTCMLVSAGAETRTLAIPTFIGQRLTLTMKTDGGDITLTAAAAVNQTGNNTLAFGAERDTIILQAIELDDDSLAWHVVSNDGVALSTV